MIDGNISNLFLFFVPWMLGTRIVIGLARTLTSVCTFGDPGLMWKLLLETSCGYRQLGNHLEFTTTLLQPFISPYLIARPHIEYAQPNRLQKLLSAARAQLAISPILRRLHCRHGSICGSLPLRTYRSRTTFSAKRSYRYARFTDTKYDIVSACGVRSRVLCRIPNSRSIG